MGGRTYFGVNDTWRLQVTPLTALMMTNSNTVSTLANVRQRKTDLLFLENRRDIEQINKPNYNLRCVGPKFCIVSSIFLPVITAN
jgi:hypothetical protein